MRFVNEITSHLVSDRLKIWEKFNLVKSELNTLKGKINEISNSRNLVSLPEYKEIKHYPEIVEQTYKKVLKTSKDSNQLTSEIQSENKEIQSLNAQITSINTDVKNIETKINNDQQGIEKLKKNMQIGYLFFFLIIPLLLISGWKGKIENLEKQISNSKAAKNNKLKEKVNIQDQINYKKEEIKQVESEILVLQKTANSDFNTIQDHINNFYINSLTEHSNNTETTLRELPAHRHWNWSEDVWSNWDAKDGKVCHDICIGRYSENKHAELKYDIPAYIPFIGRRKTLFFNGNHNTTSDINSTMESLALRIAMSLPHQVKFTFLDPSGFGKAFPISGNLDTRESGGDVYRVLETVMDDMQRIISTYSLSDEKPFDFNAENILINERFEFIFAAEFPKQYDRRVIESLQRIANTGHIAGKYVIIHHNQEIEMPRDISLAGFEHSYAIDMHKINQYNNTNFNFIPNQKPDENLKQDLVESLKNSIPPERKVEWEEEIALPIENWWEKQADEFIQTPIGRRGSSDKLEMWFGAKQSEGGRPCAHGMLGAMTGSGKSNLYHILILGLSIRYSPEELSLYLIDGKDGVEFQPYKQLPHAEFVSLKSQPQLSRSILAELLEEKERRNNIFTKYKINDYASFRKLEDVEEVLPRILLMVDEYQELFEGDKEGIASNHLLALAQQGRSAGIHMFLGSQRFGVVGMMHQSAIFGNIHLRVAMKMSLSDRQALSEFGREGKNMIGTCNLPGKVVMNDQSGEDGANGFGKVALITKAQRDEVINQTIEKVKTSNIATELLTTNIFYGSEQPNLLDNSQFAFLVKNTDWLTEEELQNFANKEVHKGGLGEIGWFAGEKPVVGWLGQEFNVRGQTKVILRRRQRENILLVGDYNEARFGMLTGLLTSFAVNSSPSNNEFYIIDKTTPGAPWNNALSYLCDSLLKPLNCKFDYTTKNKEAEISILNLIEELTKRLEQSEEDRADFTNIFLCIADPDKLESLCQTPNKYGNLEDSDLGKKLQEIYVQGPSVGIFTVLAFESVMSILAVISKKNMNYFRHRVALQMSEDDSFNFLKKREASKLQNESKKPIVGFYLDISNNRHATFKAYCLGDNMSKEIIQIHDFLKNR